MREPTQLLDQMRLGDPVEPPADDAESDREELQGEELGPDTRSHEHNPGEVWEENEFWIDLSWRIDPDGEMGIRQWFESPTEPDRPISVDEYYGTMFADSVPGVKLISS